MSKFSLEIARINKEIRQEMSGMLLKEANEECPVEEQTKNLIKENI